MEVTVTAADTESVVFHGSVVQVTGTAEDGRRVTFAGDLRPMAVFLESVALNGEATADVEDWQVTRVAEDGTSGQDREGR